MPKMCPGGDTAPAKHERSRKTSWSTEAFLLVVIIAGWTSCVPAVASDPTEILKASIPKEFRGHVLAEIKVSPEGLLLAELKARNRTYSAVVDTGATFCFFDSKLRQHLVKYVDTVPIRTAGRPVKAEVFEGANATLGKIRFGNNTPFVCLDLRHVREGLGEPIYAMVGMNALRNHILYVDFDKGVGAIVDGLATPPKSPGRRYRLHYDDKRFPQIECEIGKAAQYRQRVRVDTGSTSELTVTDDVWEQLMKARDIRDIEHRSRGSLAGMHVSRIGRLSRLRAGKDEFTATMVSEGNGNRIGNGFLRRYSVTIDFLGNAIYLRPGKRYAMATPRDRSGLELFTREGKIVVGRVAKGTPAHNVGFRSGDVIVSLNGRSVDEIGLPRTRVMLRDAEARAFDVVYERDGRRIRTKIELNRPTRVQADATRRSPPTPTAP